MKNKHDQPRRESRRAGGKGDEHKPAHHAEGIKQLPIIFAADHARMHRPFVNPAAMRIGNQTACHDRAHRRECHPSDEGEDDPIKDPRESFSNG